MDCPEERLETQPEFVHVEIKNEVFYDETEDQNCTDDEAEEESETENETDSERMDNQNFVFVPIKKEYPDSELEDEKFVKEEEDIVDVWSESLENEPDPVAVPNVPNEAETGASVSLPKRPENGGDMSDEEAEMKTLFDNEGGEGEGQNVNRKRRRRKRLWNRTLESKKRNEGKCYIDRKGYFHEGKEVKAYNHSCRFRCNEQIDEQKRQEIFNSFWNSGNWELQSSFLSSSIVINKPRRQKVPGSKSKTKSCAFFLSEHRVCKKFFLLTLDVSSRRTTNVILNKSKLDAGIPLRDGRGRQTPGNKIPDDKVELVANHIRKLIRYRSPPPQKQTPGKRYLDRNLNIRKLYELYCETCEMEGVDPVKESFYRHVFKTKFNLSVQKRHTNTWKKLTVLF